MGNLKSRLTAIRGRADVTRAAPGAETDPKTAIPAQGPAMAAARSKVFTEKGWEAAAPDVLRRTLTAPLAKPISPALPETLPLLLPDLAAATDEAGTDGAVSPEQLLFFDLETTGLSGGAGTVAFLAAFGSFIAEETTAEDSDKKRGYTQIEINQFLLLDYPGEPAFLEAVLSFLLTTSSLLLPPCSLLLTTYNGKSFDTPLLKTRCLMNGFAFPQPAQLDLLYPSRRLWKRVLPNCTQATVEVQVLGLSRMGDLPGSLAPDIWFDFLRGAPPDKLLAICDHNVKDINGLAALFAAFAEIAAAPLEAEKRFFCDAERLALAWRRGARSRKGTQAADPATAERLLEAAARKWPKAMLRYGLDLIREKRLEEGRACLEAAYARRDGLPKYLSDYLETRLNRL
jgi:uncharacterized protein YprB with RNaseH-like and TPR domain